MSISSIYHYFNTETKSIVSVTDRLAAGLRNQTDSTTKDWVMIQVRVYIGVNSSSEVSYQTFVGCCDLKFGPIMPKVLHQFWREICHVTERGDSEHRLRDLLTT